MSNRKIMVAGLICLDLTPVFSENGEYDFYSVLQQGQVTHTKGLSISLGGVVANTGLAINCLGGQVDLVAKVGDDQLGVMLKQLLSEYPVVKHILTTDQAATSYTVVLAIPGYDRIFIHDVGTNDYFEPNDIDYTNMQEIDIFHFGYPPSMKQFYLDEGNNLKHMYEKVKKQGICTSLDLSMPDMGDDSGGANWSKILQQVLPYVDLFEPSIEELSFCLDQKGYKEKRKQAKNKGKAFTDVIDLTYVKSLADTALIMGVAVVLIKCGSQGLYVKAASERRLTEVGETIRGKFLTWSDQECFIPCFEVKNIKSATGAGDTSIAAFLLSIQRGYSLRECAQQAAACGARCLGSYDALGNLCSLEELREKIDAGWKVQNSSIIEKGKRKE